MEKSTRWGEGKRVHDADRGRELLLGAAIKCITRDGASRTTMQSVAVEAHVSRRTVHRYFRTKKDLISNVTLHLEEGVFRTIEKQISQHEDDFFIYLEEAIVLGVRGLTMLDNFKTKAITADPETNEDTGLDMSINFHSDTQLTHWVQLLRKPYRNEFRKGKRSLGSLETYAKLAILLVIGHYQLQSKEKYIRESFHNMRHLSQRYNRSPQHGNYDLPLANDAIEKPKAKRIKSVFL